MSITPETYDAKQYLAALSARMEMEAWMNHRVQRIEIEDGRKFAMEGSPVLREQWRCHDLHEGMKPRVAPCNQILLTDTQAALLLGQSPGDVYEIIESAGAEYKTVEVDWYVPEIGQIGSVGLFHLSDVSKAAWTRDGRLAMYESRSEPNG
jgi:hypothetical protein